MTETPETLIRVIGKVALPFLLAPGEDFFAQSQFVGARNISAVETAQSIRDLINEPAEFTLVIPDLDGARVFLTFRAEPVAEEINGGSIADEIGRALVKSTRAVNV